jgi:polyhydroxyalkanoate synthesis repressor PhaR
MTEKPASAAASESGPTIIKKYANRRLYNTATSSYVTLEHLCQMVREGQDFGVHDAKTGEDITQQVLTQIIVEEESKGQSLLPIGFLRQIIRLYGDSMQSFVPRYLECSMDSFSRNQGALREQLEKAFGGAFPFGELERLGRQNMALFQRALAMFTPFSLGEPASAGELAANGAGGTTSPAGAGEGAEELLALRKRLNEMQDQLDRLSRSRDDKRH